MSVESLGSIPSARIVWRCSFGIGALAAAVALLSLLPFWDGLTDMWYVWLNFPEYSHSLLIPPIAAFLIWRDINTRSGSGQTRNSILQISCPAGHRSG